MARDLKLQVIFAALDKITAPLKKIRDAASPTAKAVKTVSDRLNELNAQQKTIGSFRKLSQGLSETSTKLQTAQQHIAGLARKINATATPTRAMTREFNAAVRSAKALKNTSQQQSQQLQILRDRMTRAGMSTRNLGQHERTLRADIAATNAQLAEQQRRLARVTARGQRIAGAQQHADRARTAAGNLSGAGAGATAAGFAMGMPLVKAIGEAKHYELEVLRVKALGLGDHVSADAIKFANGMKTYGTSTVENLSLMRDALTVFADQHHAEMVTPTLAKMKFANAAVFGEEAGAENERKFMDMLKVIEMRGGLASEEAFIKQAEMVQKILTATGGRVGPNEWPNVIKTGGVAAKGIKDESFYYQMEPMVQEMGGNRVGTAMMSAYQNIYQGKTTKRAANNLDAMGLIADKSKVSHDKVGQVAQLGVGALAGSDLFRENQFEWMEKILLPKLAEKGITEKNAVLDTIGGLFSNRTASNLFAQMYLQREQIHKNAKLNAGADGITDLNNKAKNLPQGQELEGLAKMHDLQKELGKKILPLYVQGLQLAASAAQGVTTFMQKHPTLAKAIAVSFGVLAASLLVLGPLMLAIAAVIGPYAMLYVLFAKIGISGGVLTPILRGIGSAFMWLGRMALWLGRAFLMNPIGLAVTAIGVAVWAIYTYWGPIKEFFSSLWGGIKTAFSGGISGIGALLLNWSPIGLFYQAFAGVMSWFGIDMPATFTSFGANIMQGLVNGIINGAVAAKEKIMEVAGDVSGWFATKLGIHSPSRVFAELGDYTMQGLAIGLQRSENTPLMQVSRMAKRLAQLGAGITIGAATVPAMAFNTQTPLAPRTSGAANGGNAGSNGNTYQIHIYAAPGMDPQELARAVSTELDRREHAAQARVRSGMYDYDN